MSRTADYENHLRTIEQLRNGAITCRTMARAYIDYADLVSNKSYGSVGDAARDDVAAYAHRKRQEWAKKAREMTARADALERDGVPS